MDNFDWGAYLREGEETYSTIYAYSDVSNKRPTSLSFLTKLQLRTYMYMYMNLGTGVTILNQYVFQSFVSLYVYAVHICI